MNLLRKLASAIAGAGIAGGIMTAAVLAGNPGQGGSPVSACKNNTTGSVRVLQPSQSCGTGESSISWNHPGMTWMGTFNQATTYSTGNVVEYSGGSWIATKSSQDDVPYVGSAYWTDLTAPGKPGAPGPQGQTGPQGNPGANGTFTQQTGTVGGPVDIGSRIDYWRRMATMTIHSAYPSRPYAVFVKLDVYNPYHNGNVTCRLSANYDSDSNTVTIYNDNNLDDYQPMSLNVVHTFTPADDIVALDCAASQVDSYVENISMTAIAGSQLINSPIN